MARNPTGKRGGAISKVPVRDRVLDAALQLLATHGFPALTQQRVANAARVRQSHVTYYFPRRLDLLRAVAEHAAGAAMAAPSDTTTLRELRERMLAAAADPTLARLMVAILALADEDPTLALWLARFEAEGRSRLAAALRAIGRPVSSAAIARFDVAMRGIAVSRLFRTDEAADRALRALALAAWRALIGSGPPMAL
jgi:AcrR family transcriptional regulator